MLSDHVVRSSSSASPNLFVHQFLRPLGLDDHLKMLISIKCHVEKGLASIACQYLILPIHLDLANDMLPSCLLLFGTELCRSNNAIPLGTPRYRPKWSPKPSPDVEVGIKKTMCSTNIPERKHPKNDHTHSSSRSSTNAGCSVFSRFNCLIPGLRVRVSWLALMIRSRLDFLPSRPSLLVLFLAVTFARRINARTC